MENYFESIAKWHQDPSQGDLYPSPEWFCESARSETDSLFNANGKKKHPSGARLLSKKELATQLLSDLEDTKTSKDPFSWEEEKLDFSLFDNLAEVTCDEPTPPSSPGQYQQVSSKAAFIKQQQPSEQQYQTQLLYNEFEHFLQRSSSVTATPPASPVEAIEACQTVDDNFLLELLMGDTPPSSPPLEKKVPVLEYQYSKPNQSFEQMSFVPEPVQEVSVGNFQDFFGQLNNNPFTRCSDSDSSSCMPESPVSSFNYSDASSPQSDPEWKATPGPSRPRTKPYTRPTRRNNPEEKRQRKKEQNKNAATRYRMKKKAEAEQCVREEEELEKRNAQLKQKFASLQSETKYLKKLVREVLIAKGVLK